MTARSVTMHNASYVCFASRRDLALKTVYTSTGRKEPSLSQSKRTHAKVRIKQILEQANMVLRQ